MDTLTDQEIQARFAELPPDIQQAIQSSRAEEHVRSIGTKFGLHIDQLGALENATYLVMLGFIDPAGFADDIARFVRVPRPQAEQIAQDISAELFAPIRSSLQTFMERVSSPSAPAGEPSSAATFATAPAVFAPAPVSPSSAATGAAPAAPALEPLAPADRMLSAPTLTPPATVDVGRAGKTPGPSAPASAPPGRSVDPYREPIE